MIRGIIMKTLRKQNRITLCTHDKIEHLCSEHPQFRDAEMGLNAQRKLVCFSHSQSF